jgi:iron complex outermembrane receptor protein
VKSELFDHRLRLNASGYHYDISNLQTFFVVLGHANVTNAGAAKINGADFEGTFIPLSDNDNWNINFGGNYMPDAHYVKYAPCPGPTLPWINIPAAGYDCSGKRLLQTPVWDLNLGTDYTIPSSVGPFNLAVVYHYTSHFVWDADYGPVSYGVLAGLPSLVQPGIQPGTPYSTSALREPAHSFVNLQVQWTSPKDDLTVSAWAKNLTGTKYLVNATQSVGWGREVLPGAPATYGATVGYHF